ncbi:sulfite exporter TauE/SafE family protein [Methylobacterium nigriterrae]|uniref:sulfite exporter TauE/SafE family protein n=1 Tax=Methylobacterium nigriterrae TaxID=3127512 RepID=UPI003013A071
MVSGIIGTGSSIMLVPVLAYVYGPKEAVPIMAVAAVMANVSRVLAWWREIDWRAFAAYAAPGALAAAVGARTLLMLPSRAVDLAIGVFLLSMVPVRHWLAARLLRLHLWHLAVAGALIGFLTGIVVSTGPISVPVFVGYGLAKGAFIGTEAAGSLAVYASKALTFRGAGALSTSTLLKGLVVGSSRMGGAFLAKPFVLRLSPDVFQFVMDGLMLASGLSMLWGAAAMR